MVIQSRIADIISRLKRVREENGLSYQRIYDIVEGSGEHVSMSTIRKVFEPGSETYGFQYEGTLKPIAAAVLGAYEPPDRTAEDVADTLHAIIDYKAEKIAELSAQLARLEESYRRRIDFLRDQIVLKDARIDRRDAMIEKLLDAALRKGGVLHVRPAKPRPRRRPRLSSEEPNGRPVVLRR